MPTPTRYRTGPPPAGFVRGLLAGLLLGLLIGTTACSSTSTDSAAATTADTAGTGAASTTIAATATPGDAFCELEDVARQAGLTISTSETDATKLQAEVLAALDASKVAAAAAPADFAEIAAKTVAQQEAVVALLGKYEYSFVKALASDDGNAFFSDPALGEVKAERDAYLQAHCNLAPSENGSSNAGITLSPGDEGIRELFQLLRLGGQVEITDKQIDCAVASLSGVLADADLQAIGAGTAVSEAGNQAFVEAISICGITIPAG